MNTGASSDAGPPPARPSPRSDPPLCAWGGSARPEKAVLPQKTDLLSGTGTLIDHDSGLRSTGRFWGPRRSWGTLIFDRQRLLTTTHWVSRAAPKLTCMLTLAEGRDSGRKHTPECGHQGISEDSRLNSVLDQGGGPSRLLSGGGGTATGRAGSKESRPCGDGARGPQLCTAGLACHGGAAGRPPLPPGTFLVISVSQLSSDRGTTPKAP